MAKERSRRPFAGLLVAGAVAAAVFLVMYFPIWRHDLERLLQGPLPFDRAVWDARKENWRDSEHRAHRMADQLVESKALVGKPRAEVIALLGEPHQSNDPGRGELSYLLGDERGIFSIDSEILAVTFGPDDRVDRAYIYTS